MTISKVFLAKCDNCDKKVEVPESSKSGNSADYPKSWQHVAIGTTRGVVCSPACGAEFVQKCWPVQAGPPTDIKLQTIKP